MMADDGKGADLTNNNIDVGNVKKEKKDTQKRPVKRVHKKKTKKPGKSVNAKREKIERPYPRVPLEEAIKIPYVLKEKNGGNSMSPELIAQALGIAPASSTFFYRAAAARDFGLTTGGRDSAEIALTQFGRDLVYAASPEQEHELKVKAFRTANLFGQVLVHYKGSKLPEMKYLGNTLEKDFKLHPKTHEEFSDLFAKNCKYLGIGSGYQPTAGVGDDLQKGAEKIAPTEPKSIVTLVETNKANAPRCFVVMPFTERDELRPKGFFDEVLRSLIVPAGKDAGFIVETANRSGSDVIQATIVNDLLDADLVLVDLTEHNPNVLFELGMRMATDKPVALIRAKGTPPIFDVDNMLRVFQYDPNLWPSTIKEDLPSMTEHIKAAWDTRESSQTYIKILRWQE
jgi:hypothetical protein